MELRWLEPPPEDFRSRRRALAALNADDFAREVQRLALYRLNAAQSAALGRDITEAIRSKGALPGLAPLRLLVLPGSTFGMLSDPIVAAAARHGVALDLVAGGDEQVEQDALDPDGLVARSGADATLIAVDHRWLHLEHAALDDPDAAMSQALERLTSVVDGVRRHGGGAPILCTVAAPPDPLFGSFDRRVAGSVASLVREVNARIVDLAEAFSGALFDTAALAERIGTEAWFDPAAWFNAKLAFSPAADLLYADYLGRLLGALRGRSRKALVLDLDNTLWGGVLGDEGQDALKLGPGTSLGEAHAAVQAYALELQGRGVLLAVSSKNDHEAALRCFQNHPGMVLQPRHISVFQANWEDKARNLEAIAAALNVGIDALVLLDDNPAERAHVRARLPQVAVPELPDDPAEFVRRLAEAGYFEAVAFSQEDAKRAASVLGEARRAEVRANASSVSDYLASLHMRIEVRSVDASSRARVVQLINKTNQFNPTTRRRTEAELAVLLAKPGVIGLAVLLKDRFSDFGVISALIAAPGSEPGAMEIDTWVMSCRVLSRRIEEAVLQALVDAVQKTGCTQLIGLFRSTEKNTPVRELYPRLGFEPVPAVAGDEQRFILNLQTWAPPTDLPFNS